MRRLTILASLLFLTPTPAAAEPPKLKTQSVTFAVIRDDPNRPNRGTRAIELVQLPPGKITLNDPDGKPHEHAIKPIWIAKYETRWDEYDVFWQKLDMTQEQLRAWRDRHPLDTPEGRELASRQWRGLEERPEMPYMPPYGHKQRPDGSWYELPAQGRPADTIHFQAVRKYCAWLSKLTGKKFRLPTEAEWEYACRAGGPPLKPDVKDLDAIAWFAGNTPEEHPHPVGKKQPNPWGLYDMLGNVGEYVIRDPKDDKGLLAGGSYKDVSRDVHSSAREPYSPKWQDLDPQEPKSTNWFEYNIHHAGFRVVMED